MSTKRINIVRIRRFASSLNDGDLAMLTHAIEFCGSDAGFKKQLQEAFSSAYDADRKGRLLPLLRGLSEAELVWLCENPRETMYGR